MDCFGSKGFGCWQKNDDVKVLDVLVLPTLAHTQLSLTTWRDAAGIFAGNFFLQLGLLFHFNQTLPQQSQKLHIRKQMNIRKVPATPYLRHLLFLDAIASPALNPDLSWSLIHSPTSQKIRLNPIFPKRNFLPSNLKGEVSYTIQKNTLFVGSSTDFLLGWPSYFW